MSTPAIIMMIVVCALVWGGFIAFLGFVWRIEKKKKKARTGEDPSDR